MTFGDFISSVLQVFAELTMISPKVCDGQLLMTPNTEALIRTNR